MKRNPIWDAAVLDAKRLVPRAQKCQAYQFADGFDNYNTASEMYETVNGTISYSSSYVRFAPPSGLTGQGIKISSFGGYVRKNLKSNAQTLIIKAAVNFAGLGSGGSGGNPFIGVWDAGTFQWSLVVFSSGAIGLERGNGGSVQSQTGPGVVTAGAWYGIEVVVTINGSSSSGQVYVNGFEVLNSTAINMQQSGNAYGNQVGIGDINDNGLENMLVDDFRVWDNTGSTQNAALGTDSRMITGLPAGAGGFAQFTPNGAAANYQCCDDNPPDGDSTYVSAASIGLQDAYAMQNPALTLAPVMVVARSYVRKDDSGTRAIELGVMSSSAIATGPSITVGSTYAFLDACIPDDPNTSAPWTAAGANAAQHYKQETA